jgi:transcriptional regulator with XRE-family HTH domain
MTLWLALGERLRAAREAKHLLQREVAAASRISHSYYSSFEQGFRSPRPDVLERIAVELELDVEEMRRLAGHGSPGKLDAAD